MLLTFIWILLEVYYVSKFAGEEIIKVQSIQCYIRSAIYIFAPCTRFTVYNEFECQRKMHSKN